MSNAESKGRDFCGTGPKLQFFMKINWVRMLLSLNEECLRVRKKRPPITHRFPSGANSVIGLSSASAVEFGVKPHQLENCISVG